MKRIILSVLAVICSTALVEAQQVLSRNAVGYVQVVAPSNGLVLAAVPFNSLSSASYTIPQVFGSQLVGGGNLIASDNVLKWDANLQTYQIFWKTLGGEWRQSPQGFQTTNTLSPGEGFWIINKRTTNQTIFLMGEVPDELSAPQADVNIVPALQFASYSYPAEIAINDTTLIDDAHRGGNILAADNLLAWDVTNQTYIIYWLPTGTNKWRKFPQGVETTDILAPGAAFWYVRRGATPFTWQEDKPYTWP